MGKSPGPVKANLGGRTSCQEIKAHTILGSMNRPPIIKGWLFYPLTGQHIEGKAQRGKGRSSREWKRERERNVITKVACLNTRGKGSLVGEDREVGRREEGEKQGAQKSRRCICFHFLNPLDSREPDSAGEFGRCWTTCVKTEKGIAGYLTEHTVEFPSTQIRHYVGHL